MRIRNSAETIPGLGTSVDWKIEGLRDAVVHEGEVCRLVTLMVGAWNHRKVGYQLNGSNPSRYLRGILVLGMQINRSRVKHLRKNPKSQMPPNILNDHFITYI